MTKLTLNDLSNLDGFSEFLKKQHAILKQHGFTVGYQKYLHLVSGVFNCNSWHEFTATQKDNTAELPDATCQFTWPHTDKANNCILLTPPGAGKSIILARCMAEEMKSKYRRVVLLSLSTQESDEAFFRRNVFLPAEQIQTVGITISATGAIVFDKKFDLNYMAHRFSLKIDQHLPFNLDEILKNTLINTVTLFEKDHITIDTLFIDEWDYFYAYNHKITKPKDFIARLPLTKTNVVIAIQSTCEELCEGFTCITNKIANRYQSQHEILLPEACIDINDAECFESEKHTFPYYIAMIWKQALKSAK